MTHLQRDPIRDGAEKLREDYFGQAISRLKPAQPVDILLITHLVDDRPSLVRAMRTVGKVRAVVPISTSVDPEVRRLLTEAGNRVLDSTAGELLADGSLEALVLELIDSSERPLVVCEIGGYLATLVNRIAEQRPGRLLGVVEGTEAGHRLYEEQPDLAVPVLSIARSPLKESEIRLVGASSLYTVERLLRERGVVCTGLQVAVLGYGKVGAGAAEAARRRGFNVTVWDHDPVRRLLALLDGFRVPSREDSLRTADLVIGATGRASLNAADLPALKDSALLISTSSRDVEFGNIPGLAAATVGPIAQVPREGRTSVLLVAAGTPVNFLDGAVLGHALDLIQSEMLAAIVELGTAQTSAGLGSVSQESRALLAETWLEVLTEPSGLLRLLPASSEPAA